MPGKGLTISPFVRRGLRSLAFNPSDIPNLKFWVNADNIIESAGKATTLTDLSGNGRNATQATTSKHPVVTANALNGKAKLTFDGLDDRLITDSFIISQPYTIVLVQKLLAASNDKGPIGAPSAPPSAPIYFTTGNTNMFAGTNRLTEAAQSIDISAFANIINGVSSTYYRNGIRASVFGDVGVNDIETGIVIGAYTDADAQCLKSDFYELLMYEGALTEDQIWELLEYEEQRYNEQFKFKDNFDNILNNSITISEESGYNIRNPFSEFEFQTTDEKIFLNANPTLAAVPDYSEITIFEDDAYLKTVQFLTNTEQEVALSAGNKKVTLVEGITSMPIATELGTFITEVRGSNFTKKNEGTVANKYVFITDSIGVGDGTTIPARDCFSRLFKTGDGISSAILGYGFGKLKDFAETGTEITATIADLTTLFSQTTNKTLIITLGTNDAGIDSTVVATWKAWYEELVDAINADDSTIQIVCVSPIHREDAVNANFLVDYNTAVSDLCSTRAFCTYLNGQPICTYPGDYADETHLNDTGNGKMHDAIEAVI